MAIKDAVFAIDEIIDFIQSGVPGVIKQMARGTIVTGGNFADETITHGLTVNPGKTLVFLNTTVNDTGGGSKAGLVIVPAILLDVTATSITCSGAVDIRASGTVFGAKVSWQLIEFF